jgi:hypothetical protein
MGAVADDSITKYENPVQIQEAAVEAGTAPDTDPGVEDAAAEAKETTTE